MISLVTSGFLAGLSVGVYCLGVCLPIFIPLILADKQNLKSGFRIVIEFSFGRLLGYLTFGGLVGFLGEVIKLNFIHQIVAIATIITGLTLVFYSFGFLKWGHKACNLFFQKVKIPLILGFLTGINICPPFLASLTYVFNLRSLFNSLLYFFSFFGGTSLYIIPAGFFTFFSDDRLIQKIARISGVFVGLFFVYKGIIASVGY